MLAQHCNGGSHRAALRLDAFFRNRGAWANPQVQRSLVARPAHRARRPEAASAREAASAQCAAQATKAADRRAKPRAWCAARSLFCASRPRARAAWSARRARAAPGRLGRRLAQRPPPQQAQRAQRRARRAWPQTPLLLRRLAREPAPLPKPPQATKQQQRLAREPAQLPAPPQAMQQQGRSSQGLQPMAAAARLARRLAPAYPTCACARRRPPWRNAARRATALAGSSFCGQQAGALSQRAGRRGCLRLVAACFAARPCAAGA